MDLGDLCVQIHCMKKTIVLIYILPFFCSLFAQKTDSVPTPAIFSGVITATNNGVSLIPSFSLGKPALLFDLSLGKGRLSFDPMLRFGMDGKPWAFVFWGRYKLLTNPKFNLSIGAHPSVVFRTVNTSNNGIGKELLAAQRYVAWEAAPTFVLSKKISVGLYYLGSHGLTKDLIQSTTFLTFRSTFSNLNLSKQLTLTLIPQVYFLKMDERQGTYLNATLILGKKNFPLAISSIVSQAIDTEIAGKELVWNLGLNYNFYKKYVRRP